LSELRKSSVSLWRKLVFFPLFPSLVLSLTLPSKMDSDDAPLADVADMNQSEDENRPNTAAADNDDSSSDSDSDSDNEAQQHLQIQTLESQLSSNPSDYDAHVQYIKLLRKTGELEKLRQARESMNQLFPLSPSMWQEWLKDEISLSSSRPEEVSTIEQLFERAVYDYLSVSVWCEYLNFVQEHDPSISGCTVDGLSKARALFERALTAAGLHFSEGSKIWSAYREFEQAVLLTIEDSDTELKEKQVQRIRAIFHRQLSVPLADMSSILESYKTWEVEQGHDADSSVSAHVSSAYKKALILHDARVYMEEHISRSGITDSERLSAFMNYLKFEDSCGDPARVHVLYERAMTEFPVSSDLWLNYTRYLNKTLKVGNVVRDVHLRATKNCPWVGELWVRYLLALERCHASEDERSQVFEKALLCTFSSYEEYLDLFLTRIDGLRRMMSVAEEIQVLDYAVIRDTFQRASDYLSPQLKGTDALLQLYTYWARLELSLRKDIAAARSVWESLLKISGLTLEAWKGYIAMEIENDNINEARSIYRRCYTKKFPGSGSEEICQLWLRFEREFGTLEDYDQAFVKVSRRLEELQLFRQQQESKTVPASVEQRDNASKKNAREKRKVGPSLTDQHPAKRQKESEDAPKVEVKMDSGPGHKPVEKNMEEMEAVTQVDGGVHEHQKKEYSREKPKFTDQCTAFISNLNFDTNNDNLGNFFSDVGGVVGIRILKDRFTGKSRGLAYVDFSNEAHLNAALAKNKRTLMGKKLSIRKSDPTKGKKQEFGKDGKTDSSGEQPAKASRSGAPALGARRRGTESVQLEGKNTFAVPRAVKSAAATKPSEDDETPKSNDEFRKLMLKK
ncbi:hypothetical protein V2J09_007460, partial [Rumex salicifolius]